MIHASVCHGTQKTTLGKKGGFFFPSDILAYTCTWCDLTVFQCVNWAIENQLVYYTDGFQAGL